MPLPNTFLHDPGDLKPEQRFREIACLLATGLHRLLMDSRTSAAVNLRVTDDAAEVSQNQLDAHARQSVYAPDGNT